MAEGKSIVTNPPVIHQTPAIVVEPRVGWRVRDFEMLIQAHGYDAYIDRAMRCPCAEKASGQALSTCRNCMGRGWFFTDRTETRVIAQHMDSKKHYQDWSEVNRGTASITTKGIDKLGFMDRIILLQLEEWYSEILRPIMYDKELVAYPIYEPLQISSIYLFISDNTALLPLKEGEDYSVDKNKMVFNQEILNDIVMKDVNNPSANVGISIRYSHYPVYHVIDVNRELMKVRESKFCCYDDETLKQMPINVLARKAHFIFDNQTFDNELIYNKM